MQAVTVVGEGEYGYCTPNFSEAPSPGYYDTSEYMLGSVAVGVILPESDGPAYNWTDIEVNSTIDGVQQATEWWKSENPEAQLSFVFDVHVQVPTIYEPIEMYEWEDFTWIEDVMSHLSYTSGSAFDRVTQYNNNIRANSGTDWAFTIFIVDSDNSVDQGKFPGGGYAHAFLGGPWITMSRYSSWAYNSPSYFKAVPAHEMGHIFYGTDEYDSYTTYSGYFNATDRNGSFGIMNRNNFYVSPSTRIQIGWRDMDLDGILDIMDTYPALKLDDYPIPIIGNSHEFSGAVVEVPHQNFNPFGQRNNLSINEIVSVEYSIDQGPWMASLPTDGAFNETLENFTCTVVFPTVGRHTLRLRVTNSVGNSVGQSFAVENMSPTPVAFFIYSPMIPVVEGTTFFDASTSHDPTGGFINRYDWDFGDGTTLSESDPFASHIYTRRGSYTVRLTVVNNIGQTGVTEKTLIVKQKSTISVFADPNPVLMGSYTIIMGTLLPENPGAVVTLEWRRYPWQDWMPITNVITDEKSEYSYTWAWGPQEVGSFEIRANWPGDELTLPIENVLTLVVVLPTPRIILDTTSGPVGTKVSVRGFDFTRSTTWYLTFDDQLVGMIISIQQGEFNATFSVPLSEAGKHKVKAIATSYVYGMSSAEATFTVIDVTPLDVNVDVGTVYFKQEVAEVYVQTILRGTPVNVVFLKITLMLPNGTSQALAAQSVGAGLYKVSYVISGKGSMQGTYMLTVEASYVTDAIQANGSALETFLVKPTWERELPKLAALSVTSIGLISAMLMLWKRERKRHL
jgi:PKD repeat protein